MADLTTMLMDLLLFAVLPYIALTLFFVGTVVRYRKYGFSYSSLSSQFLENNHHFWGLIPFHYGILTVFAGHLIGFLIPRELLWWNSHPLRLYVLEVTGLVAAMLTIVGLTNMVMRRLSDPKIKTVTSISDWVLLLMLTLQIVSGTFVAIFYTWGSSWFATSAAPYLWGVLTFSPDITYIVAMPWIIKFHLVGAYVIIGAFPFTRLVHILVVPNQYLWRKPQVVRWLGSIKRRKRSIGVINASGQR
ncbi:MAG: respiratory nitrate reductase subunit gamma [Bacteroidota bacterium]